MAVLEALGATVAAGAALGGYAFAVEPRRFRLGYTQVRPVRRPPRPFRVLQLSDTHFQGRQAWKQRFLTALAAHPVDFVMLVGDLIEDDAGMDGLLHGLRALRPRYGTYCVLGAHDFLYPGGPAIARDVLFGGRHHTARNDAKRLINHLWDAGVHIFRNDGFVLEPGPRSPFPEPVYLCGINDAYSGWDNVERAVRRRPDGLFTVMLSHALHEFHDVLEAAPDVCLAGHTHGGQVRIPFIGAVITRSSLPRYYARDDFQIGRTVFHINHGLGSGRWTPPRFNCRPEATIVDVV